MNDLRSQAAGIVCVGFEGTRIDRALERRLRELPVAGLILFARNVESLAQTRSLTDRIRHIYVNPIIAIDQEGGRVARLRSGVEEFPVMLAVAAAHDVSLARQAGEQMAFDLRRAGVNVDFAPVLDLALHSANTVIGSRSFGDDPHQVVKFAGAFASGLRAQGIAPTFKHFPGHGSTALDSHLELPVIDVDAAKLRSRDLLPFAQLLPHADCRYDRARRRARVRCGSCRDRFVRRSDRSLAHRDRLWRRLFYGLRADGRDRERHRLGIGCG